MDHETLDLQLEAVRDALAAVLCETAPEAKRLKLALICRAYDAYAAAYQQEYRERRRRSILYLVRSGAAGVRIAAPAARARARAVWREHQADLFSTAAGAVAAIASAVMGLALGDWSGFQVGEISVR